MLNFDDAAQLELFQSQRSRGQYSKTKNNKAQSMNVKRNKHTPENKGDNPLSNQDISDKDSDTVKKEIRTQIKDIKEKLFQEESDINVKLNQLQVAKEASPEDLPKLSEDIMHLFEVEKFNLLAVLAQIEEKWVGTDDDQ